MSRTIAWVRDKTDTGRGFSCNAWMAPLAAKAARQNIPTELRQQNIDACKQWLDPREYRVISFVTREMGLIVKRGNPLAITSLKDIAARKARFVNRDHDSGTRLLFDQLLTQNGIDGSTINGLEQIEFTHAAVAAYVASDMADVSFGVEAAARQFGLDFIRLLTEDYFFVCRRAFLETEPMQRLLDVVRGRAFHAAVAALPGYKTVNTGTVTTVREFLDSMDAIPDAARKKRRD